MALRGIYEGIYERPAGNYSARYQSQYQDYESFYIHPYQSSLSLSLSSLLLHPPPPFFFCFYCYHCQRGLRKLPEFLSSCLETVISFSLFLLVRGNHQTILSKTIFTLVLEHLFLFFIRSFFFFFFCSLPRQGEPCVSLILLSLARRGLEIGLRRRSRIKRLKGITG